MYRTEAIAYLKEILSKDRNLAADAVSFEHPKDSTYNYKIHIKVQNGDSSAIKEIAQKHSLEVKEENNELIISKPTVNSSD